MKNIINYIAKALNFANDKTENVTCNYANNYYGDQYCQKEVKGQN